MRILEQRGGRGAQLLNLGRPRTQAKGRVSRLKGTKVEERRAHLCPCLLHPSQASAPASFILPRHLPLPPSSFPGICPCLLHPSQAYAPCLLHPSQAYAHELQHNYNLGHAWSCIEPPCGRESAQVEYQDKSCIMGLLGGAWVQAGNTHCYERHKERERGMAY